jgi:hypothetical protein
MGPAIQCRISALHQSQLQAERPVEVAQPCPAHAPCLDLGAFTRIGIPLFRGAQRSFAAEPAPPSLDSQPSATRSGWSEGPRAYPTQSLSGHPE